MDQTDVFSKIKNIIIHELNKDKQPISPGASLKNDLSFDSVDQIELAITLEKEFNIQIFDDELGKLSTVAEIVELVKNKLGIKG